MRILYVEPFEGGSHARFTKTLSQGIEADWTLLTLPGRHWKWHMRASALWHSLEHAELLKAPYHLLLASSFLPLAELVGLCPGLGRIPRLLYFHENQLAYPQRQDYSGERDLHYGFAQMVSALAASHCLFNSSYNMESFLAAGEALLCRMPEPRPLQWVQEVRQRSRVLPVPLELPEVEAAELKDLPRNEQSRRARGPVILWNHRWEHDKNPGAFFAALNGLAARDLPFRLIVCGESFGEVPPEFAAARERLDKHILHWGYVEDRDAYLELLKRAQLVVSTAAQEFFGLAILEAVHLGVRPLLPDRLVYPELFGREYLYAEGTLEQSLEQLCQDWLCCKLDLRADRRELAADYAAEKLLPRYGEFFDACGLELD